MRAQFLSLLAARIVATVIQAVLMIVIARLVGMAEFGYLGAVIGVCTAGYALVNWGLPTYLPLARARGKDEDVRLGLAMSAISLVLGSSLLSVVLLITVPDLLWLALLPAALAVDSWLECALTVLVADGEKTRVAMAIVVRRVILLAIFVVLHVYGADPIAAYALAYLFASVVGAAEIAVRVHRRLDTAAKAPPVRSMYRKLTPYAINSVTRQARMLDVALVGAAASVVAAGLYSAAQRITNPLNTISSSAVAVLLPHSSRSTLPVVRRLGTQIAAGAVAVWCIPGAMGILFAEQVVVALFGHEFAPAAPAFAWALAALPFIAVTAPLSSLLQGQGFERYVAVNSVLFAVVNLTGVLVGAAAWGATGAAASVALTFGLRVLTLVAKLHLATQARTPRDEALVSRAHADARSMGRPA